MKPITHQQWAYVMLRLTMGFAFAVRGTMRVLIDKTTILEFQRIGELPSQMGGFYIARGIFSCIEGMVGLLLIFGAFYKARPDCCGFPDHASTGRFCL